MYRPCADAMAATIVATHWVRQNPWAADVYPLDFVRRTGKIHIPHTHTADTNGPELQKALCIANAPIGTIVVVAGKRQALLVRLTSECGRGPMAPLAYTTDPYDVFLNTDAARILPAVAAGRAVQPFVALWRSVDIIGEVAPSTVADWRTIVQMGSAGTKTNYFQNLL
jgi:hypothetical protein